MHYLRAVLCLNLLPFRSSDLLSLVCQFMILLPFLLFLSSHDLLHVDLWAYCCAIGVITLWLSQWQCASSWTTKKYMLVPHCWTMTSGLWQKCDCAIKKLWPVVCLWPIVGPSPIVEPNIYIEVIAIGRTLLARKDVLLPWGQWVSQSCCRSCGDRYCNL